MPQTAGAPRTCLCRCWPVAGCPQSGCPTAAERPSGCSKPCVSRKMHRNVWGSPGTRRTMRSKADSRSITGNIRIHTFAQLAPLMDGLMALEPGRTRNVTLLYVCLFLFGDALVYPYTLMLAVYTPPLPCSVNSYVIPLTIRGRTGTVNSVLASILPTVSTRI